jgi:hypothetical protein
MRDLARAEAMAAYTRSLLEPLVQTIERQANRVAELERENGRQSAELERAASLAVKLSNELDAARARMSTLEGRTAPHAADPAPEPFWSRPRGWIAGAATVLAIVAVVVLLGWPW